MTRQLADAGSGLLSGGLHARGSAALNGVMHPPEGGPQAVFRLRSSPALPDWRYPRFRSMQDRAACYHFATQLGGTGQNGAVWPCANGCNLGPKTLTDWHVMELGGMAEAEFGDRCSSH
jgi:hypothetical protein